MLSSSGVGNRTSGQKALALLGCKARKSPVARRSGVGFSESDLPAADLTKRNLASCLPRCSSLRGLGYHLEGSGRRFVERTSKPLSPLGDDNGCSRNERRRGTSLRTFSRADGVLRFFVLGPCRSARRSQASVSAHLASSSVALAPAGLHLAPSFLSKGNGRAAGGAPNQGVNQVPLRGHGALRRAPRGQR